MERQSVRFWIDRVQRTVEEQRAARQRALDRTRGSFAWILKFYKYNLTFSILWLDTDPK